MKEMSKSIARRMSDPRFFRFYFNGEGIDIGGAPDPLSLYTELFPLIDSVRIWDIGDGDAQDMKGVADNTYDFVHSSHCLEHLENPTIGLQNWMRILKPGGYLVVTVPDEDLYEQGIFPSTFNFDHKWTFTIWKKESWSSKSINIFDLVTSLGNSTEVCTLSLINQGYRYSLPRYDQTKTPVSESAIEIVLRKRTSEEIMVKGKCSSSIQPEKDLLVHYNQYIDDMQQMKNGNLNTKPFQNFNELN